MQFGSNFGAAKYRSGFGAAAKCRSGLGAAKCRSDSGLGATKFRLGRWHLALGCKSVDSGRGRAAADGMTHTHAAADRESIGCAAGSSNRGPANSQQHRAAVSTQADAS